MGETHPQDRVQATKEHLKEAADDLHSATKAKAAQFQNVVKDHPLATNLSAVEMVLMIIRRHPRTKKYSMRAHTTNVAA
jgi:hypothetical protein